MYIIVNEHCICRLGFPMPTKFLNLIEINTIMKYSYLCVFAILFLLMSTTACKKAVKPVAAVKPVTAVKPIAVDGPAVSYDPETKLKELGITLPNPPQPVANYVNGVQVGNLIFLAGKGPRYADGTEITGKLGQDVTIEKGYEGARLTAINQLAVLKTMLGNLNRVKRIVKVLGMVNSDPDFVEQPKVINGFSDLMVEVFGENGRHARAAVGMASLPRGQAVEIELVVEIYE